MAKSGITKTSANTYGAQPSTSDAGSGGVSQEDVLNLEKKLYSKLDEYDKKSDDRQIKAIEALGIFVALFSFISVNIQIFNRISSAWSAGFFMLLVFCALSIMIVLLDLLLIRRPENLKDFYRDFRCHLIILFLAIGIGSVVSLRYFPLNPLPGSIEFEGVLNSKVEDKINTIINDKVYKKTEVDSLIKNTENLDSFKTCIWSKGLSNCLK